MHEKKIEFSGDAKHEIHLLLEAVTEILEMAARAFIDGDVSEAMEIDPLEEVIDEMCKRFRANHIARLQDSD